MNTIKNKISKINRKLTAITLAAVIILSTLITGLVKLYCENTTDDISDQLIRFHVVANSDTVEDQLLKMKVRDEVISFTAPLIKNSKSTLQTRQILISNKDNIKQLSEKVIKENGKNYKVYIAVDKANFPTKAYGDIVLPAGQYEAFRIIIGEGKGENWWCVMYPPLCYLDVSTGVVPLEGKEELKEELNEEQYNLVNRQNGVDYEVRFKLVDTVNSIFHKSDYKEKNTHK